MFCFRDTSRFQKCNLRLDFFEISKPSLKILQKKIGNQLNRNKAKNLHSIANPSEHRGLKFQGYISLFRSQLLNLREFLYDFEFSYTLYTKMVLLS